MDYMTRRSVRVEKYTLGVTCPDALFVKSVPVPPKHEKECDHISHPGRTRMHYVTHRSCRMQKHKFSVTCHGVLYMETAMEPHEHEK
jgi:hypothetical protein